MILPKYSSPQGPGFVMADYTRQEALDSVGKGWAKLVGSLWDFCKMFDPPITISQVKEKFGGLRFYIGGVNRENYDFVYTIIGAVESLSYQTCEECGEHGELRAGGWLRTLCEEHAEGKLPVMPDVD